MKSKDKKLTTVRIDPNLFIEFKQSCARDKFTFQKLAERSMYLYLKDQEFKDRLLRLIKTVD